MSELKGQLTWNFIGSIKVTYSNYSPRVKMVLFWYSSEQFMAIMALLLLFILKIKVLCDI